MDVRADVATSYTAWVSLVNLGIGISVVGLATLSNDSVINLSAIDSDAVVPATSDACGTLELLVERDGSLLVLSNDGRTQESGNS